MATGPYLIDDTADQVWNLMAQTESNQLNQKPIYISKWSNHCAIKEITLTTKLRQV